MKKRILFILIAVIILIVGYGTYVSFFPLAKSLECDVDYADVPDVIAVKITPSDEETTGISNFTALLMQIQQVEPTRKMSVNDYPTVDLFYQVEVLTENKEYRYYIYEENSKVYLEIPYIGIYKGTYNSGENSMIVMIQDLLINHKVK